MGRDPEVFEGNPAGVEDPRILPAQPALEWKGRAPL